MPIYTDYISASLMYNLQILPETLMTGIIILAVILSNPALVVLAIGAAGTQLLTNAAGLLIMRFGGINEASLSSSTDMCNTGFIGKSWDRLLRGPNAPERLWNPAAPSQYMSTIGFFYGVGLALLQLYKEEIDKQVMSRSSLVTTTIIGTFIVIAALLFRIWSGCDSILVAITGLLFGLVLGYLGYIVLGYSTGRRATNLWGIPLLRDRINNGSPLYVCPSNSS